MLIIPAWPLSANGRVSSGELTLLTSTPATDASSLLLAGHPFTARLGSTARSRDDRRRYVDVRNRAPVPGRHEGAVRRVGGAGSSLGREPAGGPDLPRRGRHGRRLDRDRALGLSAKLGAISRRYAGAWLREPRRPWTARAAAGDDLRDPQGAAGLERARETFEPEFEGLVADREAQPHPAGATRAEALAGRDHKAVLGEQTLERDAFPKLEPEVERPLAGHRPEHLEHAVAAALVGVAPLGDRVLRPGQRRDAGLLDRPEDPDAAVVVEQVDPLDDLRVPDHEPDPPAGHPVGLGHREHLDPDLLRAGRGEKAARLAPVEEEVAVRAVVHDGRPGRLRVRDPPAARPVRHH